MDIVSKIRAHIAATRIVAILCLFCSLHARAEEGTDWINSLTSNKGPGTFAPPPPMHLAYRFGWHAIQAASADVRLSFPKKNILQIDATGGTTGLPRVLFKLDVSHQAVENKLTLRPIYFDQEEKYRSETVNTHVSFEQTQLTSVREKIPGDQSAKPNTSTFSPVFDMASALLWIRSQPLKDGDTESLVVWPSNSPYLVTVKVLGRETLKIGERDKDTIKLELHLEKIDKKMQLKPHKLFKSGRGWLSDDDKRVPLRIEVDIFIGYVFAELESMVEE
jgi:hypothetical protein